VAHRGAPAAVPEGVDHALGGAGVAAGEVQVRRFLDAQQIDEPVDRHGARLRQFVEAHRPVAEIALVDVAPQNDGRVAVARVLLDLLEQGLDLGFPAFENLEEGALMVKEKTGDVARRISVAGDLQQRLQAVVVERRHGGAGIGELLQGHPKNLLYLP
jgi:hypothetical protein